ncbi:MAG TPA: tubulin-like doman-containing protein, partial [Pirellulales bacterium]
MSTASIQAREMVFPGYQLFERIGSGGYAEVWRARAPGGIDKAVKIVYGCYGDQLAAQEMKAMERIKDVRHPFVLSLERFEVVDGRLAILTELADMSLEQRAQQCRANGLPGIPRDELLGFIADTAEALDFLAERHSLQHLDIKPANLLISGDHVKVADFGLVKELATRTQNSLVAGMTPTYSAPEMFDDAPAPQSDQYSLAIVYQEMLTGLLPFPGRTTAQLANQHLRSEPQLAALSPNDRAAVARALAKDPAERFPNCRAFVAALRGIADPASAASRGTVAPVQPAVDIAPAAPRPPMPATPRAPLPAAPHVVKNLAPFRPAPGGSTATQPTEAQSHASADTKVDLIRGVKAQHKEDVTDVAVPPVETASNTVLPMLYIALGGVGIRILSRLRDQLSRSAASSQPSPAIEMLALDTDRAEIKQACSSSWSDPLPAADTLHLALRLPQEYRDRESGNLDWLSRRWLYNIPRSLETRGYRPLGRLALVDHVDQLLSLIDEKLAELADGTPAGDQASPPEIRVVLLSSMGGGTGSGIVIDLANAIRSRLQLAKRPGKIEAVFVCSCLADVAASPLSVANTYALMTELQYVSVFGNEGKESESEALAALESHDRPFDSVYCVTAKHATDESADDALCAIAQQLALTSADGIGQVLRNCRSTPTARESGDHESLLLRSFNSAPLVAGPKPSRVNRLAQFLAHAVQQNWLSETDPIQWQLLDQASEAESAKPNASGQSTSCEQVKSAGATAKSPATAKSAASAKNPTAPKSPTEKWRECFGEHSKTRFAYEVISRIFKQAALQGAY